MKACCIIPQILRKKKRIIIIANQEGKLK